jgi:PleD family two-component response regulator
MHNKNKSSRKQANNLARKVTIFVVFLSFAGICAASAAKIMRDNAEFGVVQTEELTGVFVEETLAETTTSTISETTQEETQITLAETEIQTTTNLTTTAAPKTTVRPTTTKAQTTAKPNTTSVPKTTAKPKTTVTIRTTTNPVQKDATVKITVVDSSSNPVKTFTVKVPAGTRMNTLYLKDILKNNGYESTGEFSGNAFFAVAESGKTYSLTAYVS